MNETLADGEPPVSSLHAVVYNLDGAVVFGPETFEKAPTVQQLKFRHMAERGRGPVLMTLFLNEQELLDTDVVAGGTKDSPLILTAIHATFQRFKEDVRRHWRRHEWAMLDGPRAVDHLSFCDFLDGSARALAIAYSQKKEREGSSIQVTMHSSTPEAVHTVMVNRLDTVGEAVECFTQKCDRADKEFLQAGVWSYNGVDLDKDAILSSLGIADGGHLTFTPQKVPTLTIRQDLHPIGLAFEEIEQLAKRVKQLQTRPALI